MSDGKPIIELEHVYVARGQRVVLHDVNLTVNAGEHMALLGPNGCGKSTLLKAMTGEIYPLARTETRVRIFGRERWELTELKRRMGVVSAEPLSRTMLGTKGSDAILTGFFSSSTLWPNLEVTPVMRDRAREILNEVHAEGLAEKLVGQMSAGEQRRIMIGRAIAGATRDGLGSVQMLLLDEPSNALDISAQRDLREMLRQLARKGTSILLITHHIADILPEIERVVMMRGGRIVADAAKRELLTPSRLGELFGCAIHVEERDGYFNAWSGD